MTIPSSISEKPLRHIEHVIVLMLENRSFDNVLGGLYPKNPNYDGVPPDYYNPLKYHKKKTSIKAWTGGEENKVRIMPFPDPKEDYNDMKKQISHGSMQGFAQNYSEALKKEGKEVTREKVKQIMHYYQPYSEHKNGAMPITTILAQNYAVSDRYFGSGPVQTWPNRIFAHCGTPGNNGNKSYLNNPEYPHYPIMDGYLKWKTVFEQLDEVHEDKNKKAWKVYFDGEHPISSFLKYVNDRYFKYERGGNVSYFKSDNDYYTDFFKDLTNNQLPSYSFIEPRYQCFSLEGLIPPNSNHPGSAYPFKSETPIDVHYGELLLLKIFKALLKHPETFKKTLLFITYDEHGGLFDHVTPPKAVSPFTHKISNFNYDIYGPRVPAIFINPYIKPKTIFRPPAGSYFDHTSIISTLRDQFNIRDYLTPRDKSAPTFDGLLNLRGNTLNFGPAKLPHIEKPTYDAYPKIDELPTELPEEAYGSVSYSVFYSAFIADL